MTSKATVLLIDGLNLVRRIHAGATQGRELAAAAPRLDAEANRPQEAIAAMNATPDGTQAPSDPFVSALRGSLGRAIEQCGATHAVVALDAPGPGWRHRLLATYKAKRPPMPASLVAAMAEVRASFADFGMPCVEVPEMEADDVIASMATSLSHHEGIEVIVLSTDKSLLSLLPLGVRVRNHFERRDLDADYVEARFGVPPRALLDWLALVGDSSVGIPGVAGIGAKTASRLLQEHGSLEAVMSARAPALGTRIYNALTSGKDAAALSADLVRLRLDVQTGINLRHCRLRSTPR